MREQIRRAVRRHLASGQAEDLVEIAETLDAALDAAPTVRLLAMTPQLLCLHRLHRGMAYAQ